MVRLLARKRGPHRLGRGNRRRYADRSLQAKIGTMHRFPPRETLGFLAGLEIGQICLDPWSTQFRFADGGQITVEGRFENIDAGGRTHSHQAEDAQDTGPVLFRELLQQRIVSLDAEPFVLTLVFEKGSALRIHTDEGRYECGQIYPPGQSHNLVLIVF
jgi:hypothetical protein